MNEIKPHSDRLTCMLSSIQADLEAMKVDIGYIKKFVNESKETDQKVDDLRNELTSHISKVRGAGILFSGLCVVSGLVLAYFEMRS